MWLLGLILTQRLVHRMPLRRYAEPDDALRELFLEAVKEDGPVGDHTAASLMDLDDAQFKMLMMRRLGKEDYDRIFNNPRVEWEIR